jgi:ABC-type branched-subunit amino acid transport system substrate-binding protein
MRRTRLLQLASVATVVALGAAFAVPAGAGSGTPNADGTLVIGSLAPETGDLSAIVESLRTPVQIAIDEINAAGGVGDAQVTLVTGDDGTDPEVASQTLDRMITSDKTDVIIGPASSGTALGILGKVKGKALLCSGSNTAAQLTKDGPNKTGGLYFRTAPPDELQGPALAELILSDGNSNVAILTRNDSYGVGFGKALSKALKQGGAKVAANVAYNAEGTNFDSDVEKALAKDPDSVVVLGFNDDGAKVVQTLIENGAGPADLPVYTADGMQGSSFGETVDPANPGVVSGMKGTAPAAAPAGVESPFQEVFGATGLDPIFSSYYYDCTILAALAAVKAKSDDAADMAKAFQSNLTGSVDCNTFLTCKTQLLDGKKIHWRGASSSFDKFPKNQPKQGVYDVWSYDAAAEVVTEDSSSQIAIG